jgi:hypothetical protein
MIITILSRDKISQNIFKENILDITNFVTLGTHSNQDSNTLKERINFALGQNKDVLIFHALKRSSFAISKDWNPEPVADYQKELYEISDLLIYTPTLFQSSYGKTLTVIKGDLSLLKLKTP